MCNPTIRGDGTLNVAFDAFATSENKGYQSSGSTNTIDGATLHMEVNGENAAEVVPCNNGLILKNKAAVTALSSGNAIALYAASLDMEENTSLKLSSDNAAFANT